MPEEDSGFGNEESEKLESVSSDDYLALTPDS
jgi:hypothetical protein